MNPSINYTIARNYSKLTHFVYLAHRKLVRILSACNIKSSCVKVAWHLRMVMKPSTASVSKADVKNYQQRWKGIAGTPPEVFLKIYQPFSGIKSPDYVPDSLYYTHIEPIFNNVAYSKSFADKNMYARLFDKRVQPPVFLRKMHGQFLNYDYETVENVDKALSEIAMANGKVVLKPSIDSQGGRRIMLLSSVDGKLYYNDIQVSRQWLEREMGDNFLLQKHIQQHAFFASFNASSLNTLRVYTYRSVVDESVHVMQSMLRIGKAGSIVDNISGGGKGCGISLEGVLSRQAIDYEGNVYQNIGGVDLTKDVRVVGFEAIIKKAQEVARQQFYSRLIGFDFGFDESENVWLIELNNYDIGIGGLQKCNGPLFRDFTDEIIAYCKSKKRKLKYIIR